MPSRLAAPSVLPLHRSAAATATATATAFLSAPLRGGESGSLQQRRRATEPRYMTGIMMPVVDGLTVGERNLKLGITRSTQWLVVFYTTFLFIAFPAVMVVGLYEDPIYSAGSLWRVPVIMLWGVYMAMVAVVWQYMSLFMPHAPYAVQEAIVKVGIQWIGMPAGFFIMIPVIFLGKVWMLITTVCLFCILIAGVFVFWAWLVRAYPSSL